MRHWLKNISILPRWIIVALDLSLVSLGYFLSAFLRFNLSTDLSVAYYDKWIFIVHILIYFLAIQIFKAHVGIIRYTHKQDAFTVFKTVLFATSVLGIVNYIIFVNSGNFLFPFSILIISFFLTTSFLLGYRFLVKELFDYGLSSFTYKKSLVIYGAGMAGRITAQVINENKNSGYVLKAFLDDNPKMTNNRIHGRPVLFPGDSLSSLFQGHKIDELIIAVQNIPPLRKRWIIEECLKLSITVREVPNVDKWVGGHLSVKQIKDVPIEDLLGRKTIDIASKNAINQLSGKVVLVTGAAGSIGSELSIQLVSCGVLKLILLDQAESDLYDLDNELNSKFKVVNNVELIISDVTNKTSIEEVFKKHHPEIVFHAAAYKHVPLMENMPFEAIGTNILGTKTLADLAVRYDVKKFVLISTDKAVNPTNIMGATKRAAEMYVQSLSFEYGSTEFITTRFGNVLGSNGSVIPLFRRQIKKGGPITITHPEITRFFMTIPEACALVLEAEAMGKGGEIFVFDMGESIKILDLAKKMIKLAGLELGKDIDVKFTGLRPGEKLYEEVLSDNESAKETHHPKILIAEVQENDFEKVNLMILSINKSLTERNELEMVRKLKRLVPEFRSNASRFEILDR
jgi:FlaA1/EpsC-like NDP-sugar epimerase